MHNLYLCHSFPLLVCPKDQLWILFFEFISNSNCEFSGIFAFINVHLWRIRFKVKRRSLKSFESFHIPFYRPNVAPDFRPLTQILSGKFARKTEPSDFDYETRTWKFPEADSSLYTSSRLFCIWKHLLWVANVSLIHKVTILVLCTSKCIFGMRFNAHIKAESRSFNIVVFISKNWSFSNILILIMLVC